MVLYVHFYFRTDGLSWCFVHSERICRSDRLTMNRRLAVTSVGRLLAAERGQREGGFEQMSTYIGGEAPPTAHTLVALTEAKDPYLRGHAQRVCGLAVAIASYLGIRDRSLETVRVAALLHDVGKMDLPEHVLQKPGALTDEEFAVMQEHSERGAEIVSSAPGLRGAAAGVRSHHE